MVTVNEIFAKVGLIPSSPIKWGQPIPCNGNGVYVISTSNDPSKNLGICKNCEIKLETYDKWKEISHALNVEDKNTLKDIQTEVNKYWKPNENILYIGESSSVTHGISKRVQQFYSHVVGKNAPHTGGYWIKLIANLEDLYIYYALCDFPRDTEFKMLIYYIEKSTGKSFYELAPLGNYLPFANLKVDFQKKHNIKNAINKPKK